MREQEIRDRINQYLKARMRGMLVPALGLSLLAGACKEESATPVYSAALPDASPDQAAQVRLDGSSPRDTAAPDRPPLDAPPRDVALDSLPIVRDGGRDAGGGDEDALPDAGSAPDAALAPDTGTIAPDAALAPDTGRVDGRVTDGRTTDTGKPVDATKLDGLIGVKYIAQLVDGGMIAPLYLAQLPLP